MADTASIPAPSVARYGLAVVTVGTTLLLIFVGGVVTNTGSALAVPDWPTTFGHNMFLYPWSKMVGGIFYEHSHRLLGSTVGLLTVSLAAWIYFTEPRRWMRRLAAAAVAGVIVQGILGGMRVVLLADKIAIVHGCLAQAFLSLMVGIAVASSPWWAKAKALTDADEAATLRQRALWTAGLFYLQIVAGAFVSHTSGGLEFHLLFGAAATLAALMLAARLLASTPADSGLHGLSKLILGLLAFQLALGLGAMVVRFDAAAASFSIAARLIFPTVHRLVGACLIATVMALTWRVFRVARPLGSDVVELAPLSPSLAGGHAKLVA